MMRFVITTREGHGCTVRCIPPGARTGVILQCALRLRIQPDEMLKRCAYDNINTASDTVNAAVTASVEEAVGSA